MENNTYTFSFPELEEGATQGEIIEWLKKPKEQVRANEPVVIIMTDKVTVELLAPYNGIIVKQYLSKGQQILKNAPLYDLKVQKSEETSILATKLITKYHLDNLKEVHPLELISPNRADLMAKYIYAKHREWGSKNDFGLNLYYSHLQIWNHFYQENFFEFNIDTIRQAFDQLLDSIKQIGFDQSFPISLGPGKVIFKGAHRAVACLLYNRPTVVKKNRYGTPCKFDFLQNQGLDLKYLDAMALQYCELQPNSYIFVVYPSAIGHHQAVEKILKTYTEIVYKKEIEFTANGGLNFVFTAYEHEHFLQRDANCNQRVALNMAERFFPEPLLKVNKARVYLLQCKDLATMKLCKVKVRALFKISFDSVHCTDSHEESITLARTLFNRNSIHCLNYRKPIFLQNFDDYFKNYRKWLNSFNKESEWFCINGDAVLSAYGLKDCNELNFLSYKHEIINIPVLKNCDYQQSSYCDISLDDVLFDPDNYFFYKGVKFCTPLNEKN